MEDSEKQWKTERNQLLQDQDRLQKLHNNLQADYEKLLKEKEDQKAVEKSLRTDLRKLQADATRSRFAGTGGFQEF